MSSTLVQKLTGVRDLRKILETTVKDIGESFAADTCQIMLSNPLDPNVTSICEYRSSPDDLPDLPGITVPLVLHGRTMGSFSIKRRIDVRSDEVNVIRVILGELGDIIRLAQINDIVQRDTFREAFLIEIVNVMSLLPGVGDALFMVVNMLGKALNVSRCLFVCTDDIQAGWKCYEFWQQERVSSCQDYAWPTTDSAVIAQTLLSKVPLKVFEGQQNSYVSPVQEELQFLGVRSLLGVPLRHGDITHGCVILQQCDYRRAWTRNEVDMVQNVADKVAETISKLPEEKKVREPIMQLHQRVVAHPETQGKQSMDDVRKALKGALGQQAIPSARKVASQAKPAAPAAPPGFPPMPGMPAQPAPQAQAAPPPQPAAPAQPAAAQSTFAPPGDGAPTIMPVQRGGEGAQAAKSLGSILGGGAGKTSTPGLDMGLGDVAASPQARAPEAAPPPQAPAQPQAPQAPQAPAQEAPSKWGDLDSIGTKTGGGAPVQPAAPAAEAPSKWGDLDAIGTPSGGAAAPAADKAWGDLDSIPTPKGGPSGAGLGKVVLGKGRGAPPSKEGAASALMASFHKDKAKFAASRGQEQPAQFVEGPPIQIDEAAAKAKLNQILSSKNESSDYVFATPGLDMRMLGRIDSWITEVEAKDKYAAGHARQVAEYAIAIAKEAGLPQNEIDIIRQAALVHDVGKRGTPGPVLQKQESEMQDAELIMVMKHPIDGAELLSSFPDLQHLAPIVATHHEEFNGDGYPAGLKGEEIPVASRIIHIADSYHRMISPKKYGPGKSVQEAQNDLVKGAGTQWDPRFVQCLIQAIMAQKVPAAF